MSTASRYASLPSLQLPPSVTFSSVSNSPPATQSAHSHSQSHSHTHTADELFQLAQKRIDGFTLLPSAKKKKQAEAAQLYEDAARAAEHSSTHQLAGNSWLMCGQLRGRKMNQYGIAVYMFLNATKAFIRAQEFDLAHESVRLASEAQQKHQLAMSNDGQLSPRTAASTLANTSAASANSAPTQPIPTHYQSTTLTIPLSNPGGSNSPSLKARGHFLSMIKSAIGKKSDSSNSSPFATPSGSPTSYVRSLQQSPPSPAISANNSHHHTNSHTGKHSHPHSASDKDKDKEKRHSLPGALNTNFLPPSPGLASTSASYLSSLIPIDGVIFPNQELKIFLSNAISLAHFCMEFAQHLWSEMKYLAALHAYEISYAHLRSIPLLHPFLNDSLCAQLSQMRNELMWKIAHSYVDYYLENANVLNEKIEEKNKISNSNPASRASEVNSPSGNAPNKSSPGALAAAAASAAAASGGVGGAAQTFSASAATYVNVVPLGAVWESSAIKEKDRELSGQLKCEDPLARARYIYEQIALFAPERQKLRDIAFSALSPPFNVALPSTLVDLIADYASDEQSAVSAYFHAGLCEALLCHRDQKFPARVVPTPVFLIAHVALHSTFVQSSESRCLRSISGLLHFSTCNPSYLISFIDNRDLSRMFIASWGAELMREFVQCIQLFSSENVLCDSAAKLLLHVRETIQKNITKYLDAVS